MKKEHIFYEFSTKYFKLLNGLRFILCISIIVTTKNFAHNPSFEICMQSFILCDKYYFITNILHMLKFTNVGWKKNLNDFLKSKSNPIYFKKTKIIQNVMSILIYKNQMQKCSICDYNFWGA
jgi:hypothetical protein